jgi:hypothetical protein
MADLSDEDIKRIAKAIAHEAGPKVPAISRDEASSIAAAAAKAAIHEYSARLFSILGFDVANQKDLERLRVSLNLASTLGYDIANQKDIERMRANWDFAQMMRTTSTTAASAITRAVAVAIVLAMLGWMMLGWKTSLGAHPPPNIK